MSDVPHGSVPPARWAIRCARVVVLVMSATALWRLPFAFGYDMGMVDPHAPPWQWWAVPHTVGLIVLTEGLAYLTLGLVEPWGERVPRWVPIAGGRPVRPRAVTRAATAGGIGLCALWMPDGAHWVRGDHVPFRSTAWEVLAAVPLLFAVLWGPLLLAVTVDYWRRHRPPR